MTMRILSSDLLICDVIISPAENALLAPLIAEYNHAHPDHPIAAGSKSPLTHAEFSRWQAAIGSHGQYVAGGSAANTLSTLKLLLGDAVHIDLIATYGADMAGDVIAQSLRRDGFHLLPQTTAFSDVQTATSFVLVDAQGERSIVGYAGSSRHKILAAFAEKKLPDAYDILFLPGSLWQKYGAEFAQKLYQPCIEQHKKLWLSLPTHSQSGKQYNEAVRALIPHADILLANACELMRLYDCNSLESAMTLLQEALGAHVAFITDGQRGAYVVTQHAVIHTPPEPVSASEVKNTLGAGDAAFAGFLFGQLHEMSYEKSAQLAMMLAAENIKHVSARIAEVPPKILLDYST